MCLARCVGPLNIVSVWGHHMRVGSCKVPSVHEWVGLSHGVARCLGPLWTCVSGWSYHMREGGLVGCWAIHCRFSGAHR